jgi:hypothetical protein
MFDSVKQTWTTLVNVMGCAFRVVQHKLFAIIDAIYLLDQFLPAEIIQIWNSDSKACLASRNASKEFINSTDRIPLHPDFI